MAETDQQLRESLRALAQTASRPIASRSGSGPRQLSTLDEEHQRAVIDDKKTDTALKSLYAKRFIWILVGQLLLLNLVFIGVGIGCLEFKNPTHLNMFMGGTLAEVFGIVVVITKYLFAKRPH